MGKHKRCHKSKCKYSTFTDGNEKIIIHGRPPKIAFCEQLKAFPIGQRKCA
jgi:hypothetical protein